MSGWTLQNTTRFRSRLAASRRKNLIELASAPATVPWLADIVRLSAPDEAGARMVEGWVVGPGQPPPVTLVVGDRQLDVILVPAVTRPVGVPAVWPSWEWYSQVPADVDGELSLRSDTARVLARRPATGRVDRPAAHGAVDCPLPNAAVTGDVVEVGGWVLLNGHAPTRVEVEVDGAPPVVARIALPRLDIATSFAHLPDALFCGFQARAVIRPSASDREVGIRVTAFDEQGPAWQSAPRSCRLVPVADDPADHLVTRRGAQLTGQLLRRIPRSPKLAMYSWSRIASVSAAANYGFWSSSDVSSETTAIASLLSRSWMANCAPISKN